jgi:hypothetical protein
LDGRAALEAGGVEDAVDLVLLAVGGDALLGDPLDAADGADVRQAAVACAAAEDPAETGRAYVRALERLVNGLRA